MDSDINIWMDSDYENFITDNLKQLEDSINSSNAEAAINLIDVIVSNKFTCNITIQQDPLPISPLVFFSRWPLAKYKEIKQWNFLKNSKKKTTL